MMNIVENEHYLLDNEWWQRITEKDQGGHQVWLLQEMDLSHLIKISGDQLRRCYIDQLKEVDSTLAEHPSEQLQATRKHNGLDNL